MTTTQTTTTLSPVQLGATLAALERWIEDCAALGIDVSDAQEALDLMTGPVYVEVVSGSRS